MMQKKDSRLRRSRATRVRIGLQKAHRLTVSRTNSLLTRVIWVPKARSCDRHRRSSRSARQLAAKGKGGNVDAAKMVGRRGAKRRLRASTRSRSIALV